MYEPATNTIESNYRDILSTDIPVLPANVRVSSMIVLQKVKAACACISSETPPKPFGNNSRECGSKPTQSKLSMAATRASNLAIKDGASSCAVVVVMLREKKVSAVFYNQNSSLRIFRER